MLIAYEDGFAQTVTDLPERRKLSAVLHRYAILVEGTTHESRPDDLRSLVGDDKRDLMIFEEGIELVRSESSEGTEDDSSASEQRLEFSDRSAATNFVTSNQLRDELA